LTKILAFAQCCKEIRTNKINQALLYFSVFISSSSFIYYIFECNSQIVRRRTNGCSPIGERSSSSQRTTVRQKKKCRLQPIPKDASLHNRQGLSRPLPLREDEGGCGSEEDDAGRKVGADIRRECVFVPCPYGRAEGEKENQKEITCNLKKNKVSLEIIALSTGLSIEEISTL